ncbi:MAG: aminodeoxychorismate/anthranilate synthase component II [Planctomycetota bacterium]|nr:aminodeoxychorismate/anthranilate synthase component II [Planctomycetota bacterium]
MILVIDNYDSFTYNLVQLVGELGGVTKVYRNDRIIVEEAARLEPGHIIISPGPKTPLETGVVNELILHFAGVAPILGVCLGHQCIAHAFGGKVVRAQRVMHGKTSLVRHDGKGVYRGLPNPFRAARYHSLIAVKDSLPACLIATAYTAEGELMGVRHTQHAVEGVQFHPESFMTPDGRLLMKNFLAMRA